MSWMFAVIGILVGGCIALFNDWPVGMGAVLGGTLGAGLGRALKAKAQECAPTVEAAPSPSGDGRSPIVDLADRVGQLEQEVWAISEELRVLRGNALSVFVSKAPASVMPQPEPLDSIQRPIAEALEAPREPQAQALPLRSAAASGVPDTAYIEGTEDDSSRTATAEPLSAPIEPLLPVSLAPVVLGIVDRLFSVAYQGVRNWLLGGNTVVRIGIIVLFFGIAFLLKYAVDNSMLPVEFRLAGVALGATALLVVGRRIGERRGAYGLVLQGGGIGALYLTVFAATKLYPLLPAGAALPLLITVCALSAFLAVRQNALSLAFMGSAGGFLAPVLLSTGGGSHVALFGYYAMLNAGILAIAWFKAWRPLNLLGFVFTFAIGTTWGVLDYRPALFASTEPFLILFFAMFVVISLLYAARREIALTHYVDGTLVFGTPIAATGLQAGLMHGTEFGLAFSAVGLAVTYLGIAGWLARRRERLGVLFEAMLALAVIFATLAIPLAFTGPTTGAAWAIEGAAITWLGVRQRRMVGFGFGLLMQASAAVLVLLSWEPTSGLPVFYGRYIATFMLAVAGVFTGWWLHARGEAKAWHRWMPRVGIAMGLWGLLWWCASGVGEIHLLINAGLTVDSVRVETYAIALFAILTAWICNGLRGKLDWPFAGRPALALVPVIALLVLGSLRLNYPPVASYGWGAWAIVIGATYLLLRRQERDFGNVALAPLHTLMLWSLCTLLTFEGYQLLSEYVPEGAWSWSAWAYGFGILLILLAGLGERLRWPVARFVRAYQVWGAVPLVALLWGWSIASVVSDGSAAPLTWIPLVNPLDLAQLLAALAIVVWLRRLTALGIQWHSSVFDYAALATLFLWFNALLLRALHQHLHVPYDLGAVLASSGWQQVFLVGWSAFAFIGMWLARREGIMRLCAISSTPLILVMWAWTFYANLTMDGGRWARLPLLNPLDLVQLLIFAVAAMWLVRVSRLGVRVIDYRGPLQIAAAATGFLWLNTMLLRTLHYWADVPYTFDEMAHSTLVQASVSLFWTVCALATMIWATHRAIRTFWFVGAALLGVTIVKLFIFDFSHVKGLEQIVSFIGIGLMLLLIGYFSPLPPKAREAKI